MCYFLLLPPLSLSLQVPILFFLLSSYFYQTKKADVQWVSSPAWLCAQSRLSVYVIILCDWNLYLNRTELGTRERQTLRGGMLEAPVMLTWWRYDLMDISRSETWDWRSCTSVSAPAWAHIVKQVICVTKGQGLYSFRNYSIINVHIVIMQFLLFFHGRVKINHMMKLQIVRVCLFLILANEHYFSHVSHSLVLFPVFLVPFRAFPSPTPPSPTRRKLSSFSHVYDARDISCLISGYEDNVPIMPHLLC